MAAAGQVFGVLPEVGTAHDVEAGGAADNAVAVAALRNVAASLGAGSKTRRGSIVPITLRRIDCCRAGKGIREMHRGPLRQKRPWSRQEGRFR